MAELRATPDPGEQLSKKDVQEAAQRLLVDRQNRQRQAEAAARQAGVGGPGFEQTPTADEAPTRREVETASPHPHTTLAHVPEFLGRPEKLPFATVDPTAAFETERAQRSQLDYELEAAEGLPAPTRRDPDRELFVGDVETPLTEEQRQKKLDAANLLREQRAEREARARETRERAVAEPGVLGPGATAQEQIRALQREQEETDDPAEKVTLQGRIRALEQEPAGVRVGETPKSRYGFPEEHLIHGGPPEGLPTYGYGTSTAQALLRGEPPPAPRDVLERGEEASFPFDPEPERGGWRATGALPPMSAVERAIQRRERERGRGKEPTTTVADIELPDTGETPRERLLTPLDVRVGKDNTFTATEDLVSFNDLGRLNPGDLVEGRKSPSIPEVDRYIRALEARKIKVDTLVERARKILDYASGHESWPEGTEVEEEKWEEGWEALSPEQMHKEIVDARRAVDLLDAEYRRLEAVIPEAKRLRKTLDAVAKQTVGLSGDEIEAAIDQYRIAAGDPEVTTETEPGAGKKQKKKKEAKPAAVKAKKVSAPSKKPAPMDPLEALLNDPDISAAFEFEE